MLKCNSTLPPRGTYRFDNQEIIDGGIIGGIRVELREVRLMGQIAWCNMS